MRRIPIERRRVDAARQRLKVEKLQALSGMAMQEIAAELLYEDRNSFSSAIGGKAIPPIKEVVLDKMIEIEELRLKNST